MKIKFKYLLPLLYICLPLIAFLLIEIAKVIPSEKCTHIIFSTSCSPSWTTIPYLLSIPGFILSTPLGIFLTLIFAGCTAITKNCTVMGNLLNNKWFLIGQIAILSLIFYTFLGKWIDRIISRRKLK